MVSISVTTVYVSWMMSSRALRTPLPKYAVTSPKIFKARTFTEITSSGQKFQCEGGKKKDVKHFNNCEQEPLYGQAGEVLHKTSCMPLHITLGIGT